jgi:hypothetical protein
MKKLMAVFFTLGAMNLKRTLFVLATVMLMTFAALPSFATSCWVEPFNRLVVDDGGIVPVNVPGIPWLSNSGGQEITLTDAAGTEVEFTISGNTTDQLRIIQPVDWAQGNTYKIVLKFALSDEDNNSTNNASLESQTLEQTIHVGPALPTMAPSSFDISQPENGVTYDSYIEPRDSAWVDVKANFETGPPSNFYMYKTLIDGVAYSFSDGCRSNEAWPGRTIYGPGADRLVVSCGGHEGLLEPGIHEFRMEVRIMGTNLKELSPPLELNIPCETSSFGGQCSSADSNPSIFLFLLGFLIFGRRTH